MKSYKRYIPIVAIALIALGVNLEPLGIDLKALSQGDTSSLSQLLGSDDSDTQNRVSGSSMGSSAGQNNNPALTRNSEPGYAQWSDTRPNINLWHVFEGEINRSGKPTGFHSRPDGQDPVNARLVRVRDAPNRYGVYTATIEIRDNGQWKQKFSSFFPDAFSRNEVIEAILNAYNNSDDPRAQPFEGPSGHGFVIQGYTTRRGGINTAFPIYTRN